MTTLLGRLGFSGATLAFTLRTGCAAAVALILAWVMGLEHPQWAAMSVWAASQPLRGQVIEKSFFRILGTLVGAVVGVGLVMAGMISPWLTVIGFAVWVALATYASHLLKGYMAYGTVLAGYTAGMVALLIDGSGEGVLALGFDRFATVLTGVLTATVVGLLFSPKGLSVTEIADRGEKLLEEVLGWLAQPSPDPKQGEGHLMRIAEYSDMLDVQGTGLARLRREDARLRAPLLALIPLIIARNLPQTTSEQAQIMREASETLLRGRDLPPLPDQGLQTMFARLERAIAFAPSAEATPAPSAPRDWIGAGQAGLRALLMLVLFGVAWQVSGVWGGNFLMLGLAVMISIISTFDSPIHIMPKVLLGQCFGIAMALACRWLVWPWMGSEMAMVLAMVPFILMGAVIFGHPKGAVMGFDLNMVFLLLLSPTAPAMSFEASVLMSGAVLVSPLIALAAYHLVFKASGQTKFNRLIGTLHAETQSFATRKDREAAINQLCLRALHCLSLGRRWAAGKVDLPKDRILACATLPQ